MKMGSKWYLRDGNGPCSRLSSSARKKRKTGEKVIMWMEKHRALKALAASSGESESECHVPNPDVHIDDGPKSRKDLSGSESIFKCLVCNLSLDSKFELKSHSLVHVQTENSDGKYQCDECGRSYNSARTLKIHRIDHFCNLNVSASSTGSIEKQSQKSNRNAKQEPVCESKSTVNENCYPCSICSKSFTCFEEMRKHEGEHTNQYTNLRRCLSHVVKTGSVVTKSDALPSIFKCPTCDLEFDSAVTLEAHFVEVHLHFKPVICPVCNLAFKEKDFYEKHVESHCSDTMKYDSTSEREKSAFECVICNKTFKCMRNFESHQKVCFINCKTLEHVVNPDYKGIKMPDKKKRISHWCNLCFIKFSSSKILDHHIIEKHGSFREFNEMVKTKFIKQKSDKSSSEKVIQRTQLKGKCIEHNTNLVRKNMCVAENEATEVIQHPQNTNTENPFVIHLNQTQVDPPKIYDISQPALNLLNTTTTPDIQNLTLSNTSTLQNEFSAIPEFDFDSEEYIAWLKSFINSCKTHQFPLPLKFAKTISKVSDDLFNALIIPKGSMERKENHFYLLKFYQTVSSIMLKHAKHYLTPE